MVCNYLVCSRGCSIIRKYNFKFISLLDFPRKRKILVLVNPFSGKRLAAANWEKARPILEKSHIEMNIIMTERAGHAYEIVN